MSRSPFQRDLVSILLKRLQPGEATLQLMAGPRQVGKTTAVLQVVQALGGRPCHYASADDTVNPDQAWLSTQWTRGRAMAGGSGSALLVLDEIQRVPDWPRAVKALWDQDRRSKTKLSVVLLGSSALLLQKGVTESLAGRFEMLPVTHWNLAEEAAAFSWGAEQHLLFGGYPGTASLIGDPVRWRAKVIDSLVEPALTLDVLSLGLAEKPALLRGLFSAACAHAAQVVSYTKLLGQLTDRGNTTVLAHYQTLLERAWLVQGLSKYSGSAVRQRASSPKWLPLAPALVTAVSGRSLDEWSVPGEARGQLVEAAVGARLAAQCRREGWKLYYWREGQDEVDYVVKAPGALWAMEVKSGRARSTRGLTAFLKRYPKAAPVVVDASNLEATLREGLKGALTGGG